MIILSRRKMLFLWKTSYSRLLSLFFSFRLNCNNHFSFLQLNCYTNMFFRYSINIFIFFFNFQGLYITAVFSHPLRRVRKNQKKQIIHLLLINNGGHHNNTDSPTGINNTADRKKKPSRTMSNVNRSEFKSIQNKKKQRPNSPNDCIGMGSENNYPWELCTDRGVKHISSGHNIIAFHLFMFEFHVLS